MAEIFRMAAKQAIKELIEKHASSTRFGMIIDEDSMEGITDSVVDLFESTIELRSYTKQRFSPPSTEEDPPPSKRTTTMTRQSSFFNSSEGIPRTRSAGELYETMNERQKKTSYESPQSLPLHEDLSLPKKRYSLTEEELRKLRK